MPKISFKSLFCSKEKENIFCAFQTIESISNLLQNIIVWIQKENDL